jgi:hypothetical protein
MVTRTSPWDIISECTAIFPREVFWKATQSRRPMARTSATRARKAKGYAPKLRTDEEG